MSDSVEKLAAMLLAAAIKEGRDDYVQALQNLVPLKEAINELISNVDQFDENWRKRLLRTSYTPNDVSSIFSKQLLKNPDYVEFTVEAAASVTDKGTQYSMIKNMLKEGLYGAAAKAVESIADAPDFTNWLATSTTFFARANKKVYLYTIGDETDFTREAAFLFDKLSLEVPDDFDGEYKAKARQWSLSKFDAVVDWVSELCRAPRAKVGQDGELIITNASLVRAFQQERQRVMSKGEWHQDVFPSFVPVIADTEAAKALTAKGNILLAPEYGVVGRVPDSNDFVSKPSHNFMAPGHPDLDAGKIAAAMTLLSYEDVTALRASGSQDSVFLIPAGTQLKIEDCEPTPETLRIAMRYHRPEYLCSRYKGNVHEFESTGLSTRSYLRGVPASSELNRNEVRLHWELLDRPEFIKALNSPQEIEFLREIHNPRASAPLQAKITQSQNIQGLPGQVEHAAWQYEELISKLGYVPAAMFKGTQEFLQAFAEELTHRGLEVSGANTTRYIGSPGGRTVNASQSRLDARLGLLQWSKFRDMPMEDLLLKGSRQKGDADKATICGILDRLGVLGVANLAKTPSQRKFVIENFDLQSHYKDLPKPFRLAIGGQILEEDLGM